MRGNSRDTSPTLTYLLQFLRYVTIGQIGLGHAFGLFREVAKPCGVAVAHMLIQTLWEPELRRQHPGSDQIHHFLSIPGGRDGII